MPTLTQIAAIPPRFRPPRASPADMARARLFERLDQAGPVTVVTGPAGSGKTSLLASWAATLAPDPIAWFGLGRHDDAPDSLWTGIVLALRNCAAFPRPLP